MSAPSWASYAGFKPAPCLPCCETPAASCSCSLQVAKDTVGYAIGDPMTDYASALNAMTNYASCWSFEQDSGSLPGTGAIPSLMTADVSVSDQLTLHCTAAQQNTVLYASVNLKSGSTVSIGYTVTGGAFLGGAAFLLSCNYDGTNGTIQERDATAQPGMLVFSPVASDGEYIIQVEMDIDAGTEVVVLVISADDTMTVNPVIALWDDSGTTRPLEACPTLEIGLSGIGTPTPTPFANQTDAQDCLDSIEVSNCIGWTTDNGGGDVTTDSFTATDGGTSLEFNITTSTSSTSNGTSPVGCINLVAGDVLGFTWSASSPPTGFTNFLTTMNLYDYNHNLIGAISQSGTSGSGSFSAAPYTGKYFVEADVAGDNTGFELVYGMTADTVFSATHLSVNPLTAIYVGDPDTNCPSRLDCTDGP